MNIFQLQQKDVLINTTILQLKTKGLTNLWPSENDPKTIKTILEQTKSQ